MAGLLHAARASLRTAPALHMAAILRTEKVAATPKHPDVRTIFTPTEEPTHHQRVPVKNPWLALNTESYTDTHTRPPLTPREQTRRVVAALDMDYTPGQSSSDPLRRFPTQQRRHLHTSPSLSSEEKTQSWLTSAVKPVPETTIEYCFKRFHQNPNHPLLIRKLKGNPALIKQLERTIARSIARPYTLRYQHNFVFGDSGLGGLIFAIQLVAAIKENLLGMMQKYDIGKLVVKHIGDTLNAPYGGRTKEELAILALNLVLMGKNEGANYFVMACNTASTVIPETTIKTFQEIIKSPDPIVQIIDRSAKALYENAEVKINPTTHKEEIHILVLATPFVINISQVYKHKLEEMHQQTHQGKGPTLVLHQIGPKNWVHNIETGADINEQHKEVKKEIDTYMNSLPSEQKGMISVAGLYCTHYPFYLPQIRDSLSEHSPDLKEIPYIQQGALFGDSLVDDIASEIAKGHIKERDTPLTREKASELFDGKVLSLSTGKNLEQTESALAQLNLLSEVSDIRPYPVD